MSLNPPKQEPLLSVAAEERRPIARHRCCRLPHPISTQLLNQPADDDVENKKTKQKKNGDVLFACVGYMMFSRVGGQYAHARTETKAFTAQPIGTGGVASANSGDAFCFDDVTRFIHYIGLLSADPHIT